MSAGSSPKALGSNLGSSFEDEMGTSERTDQEFTALAAKMVNPIALGKNKS